MAIWNELRLAARTWTRTPALASVIILTLTLGVGATTTAFTLVYSVLVQPPPFPEPERLVWVTSYNREAADGNDFVYNSNRMSQFLDWQQHLTSLERLAAWSGTAAPDVYTVTGVGTPERVNGLRVTQQLLPMLGARPAAGRLFVEGDDAVNAAATVVLSYGYWQRRFGARPDVPGQSIIIDNVLHTIAGVLSADFRLSDSVFAGASIDVFLPLERNPANDNFGYFMTVLGRMRPGVTLEQVRADLDMRQAPLAETRAWMKPVVQKVTPFAEPMRSEARSPVLLLMAAVGCVLLMACVNLANLLLVRASGRRREMQVRAALGATTRQVLRQTFSESAVLAVLGGGAGLALAAGLTRIVRTATWLGLPRLPEAHLGWTGIGLTASLCALTTVVFGCVPLLHLRRRDLLDALRPHAGVTTDRRAARAQRLGLAAQVAFALLLTSAGGLMVRSFVALLQVDPGFKPQGVIAMRVDPAGRLAPPARMPFFDQLLSRVSAVPGVESAALAINLPMDRNMGWDVSLPGEPPNASGNTAFARLVSPGYFRTVGIRIAAGRDFDSRDLRTSPWVMAINQTLARRLTALGREPLGATFTVNGSARQVVAVVADVKHQTLAGDAGREFYIPHTQAPTFFQAYDLVVRAAEPSAIVPAVREAVWSVDRNQAIGTPVALQELVDRTLIPQRVLTWLLGGFATAALLLAALGVYGVVGYRVAQRTKEIAIRVALGSPRWRVTSTVLRDTLAFVAVGLVAGLPVALAVGSGVRAYLFGVAPRDVPTLIAACAVVFGAALVAAYIPARRAPRIDPISTLRAE
jgi:putative ABC transport system permease protein